jgi:sugar phosphate isomerase/epimerase
MTALPAHEWTRRQWLWLLASGATAASSTLLHGQKNTRPLGVQLYTVRDVIKTQPEETLKAIAAIGYKEIELGRADLRLVPIAKNVGLTAVSTHVEVSLITGKAGPGGVEEASEKATIEDAMARAFDIVRTNGLTWAVVPYLDKKARPKDADGWKRLGEQLNRAGAAAKKAGLGFGYHNHGFEFETVAGGTERVFDILEASFDRALVKWELDVYWVGITGADPVALLKKLGDRVGLVHLKDKDKTAPAETDEGKVARTSFKEVGSGGLDFPAILKAAEAAGVKHFFVEQDQTPGDPVASLKQSYTYLSSLT